MTKNSTDPGVNVVSLPNRGESTTAAPAANPADSTMVPVIFRELENAVVRTRTLENALKASQSALLRAQAEFEARYLKRGDSDRELARHYETALKSAKDELRAKEETATKQHGALEEKIRASAAKVEQLTQQLKSGAAKWNDLVAKVKHQNEQITRYRRDAEQARALLSQESQNEKSRRVEAEAAASRAQRGLEEIRANQQQLQSDLLDAKRKLASSETEAQRCKAAWSQASQLVAERDRKIAELTRELARTRDLAQRGAIALSRATQAAAPQTRAAQHRPVAQTPSRAAPAKPSMPSRTPQPKAGTSPSTTPSQPVQAGVAMRAASENHSQVAERMIELSQMQEERLLLEATLVQAQDQLLREPTHPTPPAQVPAPAKPLVSAPLSKPSSY